jgi:glycosyltransferase involved in cell wall biosynthesis
MRVLHVYNLHRQGGGADNATLATINALRERGVQVETFVRNSGDISLDLRGKIDAFVSGLYARAAVEDFTQRLRSFRPNIVHVHELYPLISPWILKECRRRGVPTVMSVYDYRLTCPVHNHYYKGSTCTSCIGGREYKCVTKNCRGNRAESLAFGLRSWIATRKGLFSKNVDRYITPTSFTANWMITNAGIRRRQIDVVPCLIDIPPTTVDPSNGSYIAFAGRFVPEKGVGVAISAARKAGLPIRLAGDANSHHAMESADDVRFVRTRNSDDLAAFYRGARMFVMPSIWFETFGIVVGESMSHGVPVLASSIGALAETTVDGVTGLLFEPGNSDDLAAKMRRLWDDAEYCRKLGRGAREHIVRTASPDVHYKKIIEVYERFDEHLGKFGCGYHD